MCLKYTVVRVGRPLRQRTKVMERSKESNWCDHEASKWSVCKAFMLRKEDFLQFFISTISKAVGLSYLAQITLSMRLFRPLSSSVRSPASRLSSIHESHLIDLPNVLSSSFSLNLPANSFWNQDIDRLSDSIRVLGKENIRQHLKYLSPSWSSSLVFENKQAVPQRPVNRPVRRCCQIGESTKRRKAGVKGQPTTSRASRGSFS